MEMKGTRTAAGITGTVFGPEGVDFPFRDAPKCKNCGYSFERLQPNGYCNSCLNTEED